MIFPSGWLKLKEAQVWTEKFLRLHCHRSSNGVPELAAKKKFDEPNSQRLMAGFSEEASL
jgi:hypothetical protein